MTAAAYLRPETTAICNMHRPVRSAGLAVLTGAFVTISSSPNLPDLDAEGAVQRVYWMPPSLAGTVTGVHPMPLRTGPVGARSYSQLG